MDAWEARKRIGRNSPLSDPLAPHVVDETSVAGVGELVAQPAGVRVERARAAEDATAGRPTRGSRSQAEGAVTTGSGYVARMRLHETVLRMREWLLARDVELTPRAAHADELYEGEGQAAHQAWQAFRAVATEPASDPIKAWGETQPVSNAGFVFEGVFSQGWPKNPHSPRSHAMPEHYELIFTRRFYVGDAGDMMGLTLTIFVPAAEELRDLRATILGGEGGGEITDWLDEVEADPAFRIPMMRHKAERFAFSIDGIG
jgi:hypothetical protein